MLGLGLAGVGIRVCLWIEICEGWVGVRVKAWFENGFMV